MYRDIPAPLRALVEPVVADHGFELVDADVHRGPAGSVVREVETCIDADGLVPLPYTLEVSSPGLDRVLGREKDFAAACGHEVKIETRRPIEGRRRFRGELVAFDGSRVQLRVDGKPYEIDFADVAKANQVYHFTNADFAKKGRPTEHPDEEARR
jgi:ribosome maturation factor RimP